MDLICHFPYLVTGLDLFTVGVTLVSCMAIGVEIGLLIGVTVGLFHLIYQWARPDILVQTSKVKTHIFPLMYKSRGKVHTCPPLKVGF